VAKNVNTAVLDLALNDIKTNVTRMTATTAQSTTYTEANATHALADATMANGDFTLANGDVSGRKVTVAAKTGITIDTSGTATHVALLDVTNTTLKLITTCTSQALSVGGTVDFPSWKWEINQPS
jgi:hypothetical protein